MTFLDHFNINFNHSIFHGKNTNCLIVNWFCMNSPWLLELQNGTKFFGNYQGKKNCWNNTCTVATTAAFSFNVLQNNETSKHKTLILSILSHFLSLIVLYLVFSSLQSSVWFSRWKYFDTVGRTYLSVCVFFGV